MQKQMGAMAARKKKSFFLICTSCKKAGKSEITRDTGDLCPLLPAAEGVGLKDEWCGCSFSNGAVVSAGSF